LYPWPDRNIENLGKGKILRHHMGGGRNVGLMICGGEGPTGMKIDDENKRVAGLKGRDIIVGGGRVQRELVGEIGW